MFLIRLIHISSFKSKNNDNNFDDMKTVEKKNIESNLKTDAISQIRNITQEKEIKSESQTELKIDGKILIKSFDQLLDACIKFKEIKLRYELEKNVNLVSFENNRIEISFNDNLDKNFVKDLSLKLFEWTSQRWIISFSKTKGEISVKQKEIIEKAKLIKKAKDTNLYKSVLEKFSDANLKEVISKDEHDI